MPSDITEVSTECDSTELQNVLQILDLLLASMTLINDPNSLRSMQSLIEGYSNADSWVACNNLIKKATFYDTSYYNVSTNVCFSLPGTLNYATDPCCNTTLGYYYCCQPRPVMTPVTVMKGLDGGLISSQCRVDSTNIGSLLNIFSTYNDVLEHIDDPNTGCRANTYQELGTNNINYNALWNQYTSFVSTCNSLIFGVNGVAPTCTVPTDCYTQCVIPPGATTGSCIIPYNNAAPYLAQCYADNIDEDIQTVLLRLWGVYNSTDNSNFETLFKQKAANYRCSGPSGYYFNGGRLMPNPYWDYQTNQVNYKLKSSININAVPKPISQTNGVLKYNDSVYTDYERGKYTSCNFYSNNLTVVYAYGCFDLPASQTACLAQKKCNWDAPNADACFLDSLGNGGYSCGRCYGKYCYDISKKPLCYLNTSPSLTNTVCTDIGGKLYADPKWIEMKYSPQFCVKPNVTDVSSCISDCYGPDGPKPGRASFCVNYDITSVSKCNSMKSASMVYIYNLITRSYVQRCVAPTGNALSCKQNYGSFGFVWDLKSKTETEIKSEMQQNCEPEYCFNIAINKTSDCLNLRKTNFKDKYNYKYNVFWKSNLNDTNGYCIASRDGTSSNDPSQRKSACLSLGSSWRWYSQHIFEVGWGETSERCQEGICNFNPSLPNESCKKRSYCNYACQGCDSRNGPDYAICFHSNATQCATDNAIASWNSARDMCIYNDINSCMFLSNSSMISCSQFSSNSTQCSTNPYQTLLNCNWGWQSCDTAEKCYNAGYCKDWELNSGDINSVSGSIGACIFPPTGIGKDGWPLCNHRSYMAKSGLQVSYYNVKAGCLGVGESDPTGCSNNGGTWKWRSTTPQKCLENEGCCEPGKKCNMVLTPKSRTQCTNCGGFEVPLYGWRGGNWHQGQMVPGTWFKKELSSINNWSLVVNMNTLYSYVNQAVSIYVGSVLMREYNCRLRQLFPLLKEISCKCGINADHKCRNFNSQDAVLGQQEASCGEAFTLYSGKSTIRFIASTIRNCSSSFSFSYGSRTGAPSSSSSNSSNTLPKREFVYLGKRYDSTQIPSPCYAIVQNNYSAYIGQLRGDCATFSPSGPVSNVEICTTIKASIPFDAVTYPVLGMATSFVDSKNAIRYLTNTLFPVYTRGTSLCTIVSEGGVFCPVSLINNWITTKARAQPACNLASQSLSIIQTASQVLAGSATKLIFFVQPSTDIIAGTPGDNVITIKFIDKNGNVATDSKASVTLNILTGTGASGAILLGTIRQAAMSGVVEFPDISVSLVGKGYILQAVSGNLPIVQSKPFSVSPGSPAALLFKVQPAGAVVGINLLQQPQVSIIDMYGNNIVNDSSTEVNLQYSPSDEILFSAKAKNGIVSFSNVSFSSAANGISIYASTYENSLSPTTSDTFNVVPQSGYAIMLSFTTEPRGMIAGIPFQTQPVVAVVDAFGEVVDDYIGSVTISVLSGPGVLLGKPTVSILNGYASYSDLLLTIASLNYTLEASSVGLRGAKTSNLLVNGEGALEFSIQPVSTMVGNTVSCAVQVLDINGNLMKSSTLSISLSIKMGASSLSIAGTTVSNAVDGIAAFPGVSISSAGTKYQLIATANNGLIVYSEPFDIMISPLTLTSTSTVIGLSSSTPSSSVPKSTTPSGISSSSTSSKSSLFTVIQSSSIVISSTVSTSSISFSYSNSVEESHSSSKSTGSTKVENSVSSSLMQYPSIIPVDEGSKKCSPEIIIFSFFNVFVLYNFY